MQRRTFLVSLGIGGLVTISGCSELQAQISGNKYIEEHNWTEDDQLELVFAEDHDTDGYGILHEHHSDIEDSILSGESPDFQGPLTLDIIRQIREEDYPSYNFQVKLYEGQFGPMMSLAEEELGSYDFEVPEEKVPDEVLTG